jgi:hypothetical protein
LYQIQNPNKIVVKGYRASSQNVKNQNLSKLFTRKLNLEREKGGGSEEDSYGNEIDTIPKKCNFFEKDNLNQA